MTPQELMWLRDNGNTYGSDEWWRRSPEEQEVLDRQMKELNREVIERLISPLAKVSGGIKVVGGARGAKGVKGKKLITGLEAEGARRKQELRSKGIERFPLKTRGEIDALIQKGIRQKNFYGDTAQAILGSAQGNLQRAKDVANPIAIRTASPNVLQNYGHGTRAYYQNLMGDPIKAGIYPTEMGRTISNYYKHGEGVTGPKRNPFGNALVRTIDPTTPQYDVANDIWGARAFGTRGDVPTATEHKKMTLETILLAIKNKLTAEQAQASFWSAVKAKTEALPPGVRAQAKTGLHETVLPRAIRQPMEEFRRNRLREAMLKQPVTQAQLEQAGSSYKEAMDYHTGYVSAEAVPSIESGIMPEIHNAPYEVRKDLTNRINNILGTEMENILGILTNESMTTTGTGSYQEGDVVSYNPSTQIGIILPLGPGGVARGEIDPSAKNIVETFAAIRGTLLHQDGVGYARPFASPTTKGANAFEIDFGRPITHQETAQLVKHFQNQSGLQKRLKNGTVKSAVYLNPSKNGVHIYHDTWGDVDFKGDHTAFIKTLESIISSDTFFPGQDIAGEILGSDGDLIEGGKNGELYAEIIRRNGKEVQASEIYSLFSDPVRQAYRDIAREQGWSDPFPPSGASGASQTSPVALLPINRILKSFQARPVQESQQMPRGVDPFMWKTYGGRS